MTFLAAIAAIFLASVLVTLATVALRDRPLVASAVLGLVVLLLYLAGRATGFFEWTWEGPTERAVKTAALLIGLGLPSVSSFLAVRAAARLRNGARIAIGLATGIIATVAAPFVTLVIGCFSGDCI